MQNNHQLKLLNLKGLKAHEKISKAHCQHLMNNFVITGKLIYPIVVDKKSKVILDGHHRTAVLKKLGYNKIPAVTVDYHSRFISVKSRRPTIKINKKIVLKRGQSGKLFPYKTTKHDLKFYLQPINLALKQLTKKK